MADDLEEKSDGFDLPHYLGLVRRRHMHFLIPLLLGWLVGMGRELGSAAPLSLGHAHSGRAAHNAERLRHAQCQR